jgi:hypothetical protein
MKKPFEGGAGMVPLYRRGERSLKPSIFCLAGAKDACLGIHKPGSSVFSTLSLIFAKTTFQFYPYGVRMLPSLEQTLTA